MIASSSCKWLVVALCILLFYFVVVERLSIRTPPLRSLFTPTGVNMAGGEIIPPPPVRLYHMEFLRLILPHLTKGRGRMTGAHEEAHPQP